MTRLPAVPSLRSLPGDCPVTWAVIGANAATFLLAFLGFGAAEGLLFVSHGALARPWTALTYPLVAGRSALWVLLASYVLWLFGGSLERGWGSRDYAVFLAMAAAAPALALAAATAGLGRGVVLAGPGLPLAAAVVAWSAINPRERVLAYFVVPIEGRWMGVIAAALVLFGFPFPLGVFALAGCGLALWYVRAGRYRAGWHRLGRPPGGLTLSPLRAWRRWRLRRRFARVVRSLHADDPDSRIH